MALFSWTFSHSSTPKRGNFISLPTSIYSVTIVPHSHNNCINIQSTFNIKKERINKLIKDIKRQVFGFRNFKNFKTKIYIALNIEKERTKFVLSRC
ncbi:TPA: transposase [Streptococcus suis]